ncbi:4-aminobutyrate aminotransferase [Ceratobasidium sp. AG-Ba]|nr:4-aminobutyrate aminotransferase [Ceratobasidium sp. AG-Ba]
MRSAVGLLLAACGVVRAYIPAQGTNDTSQLKISDVSSLKLMSSRFYSDEVSYQLARTNSSGYAAGAIVYFSEEGLTSNDTTATPWIAFISCDKNATNASPEVDIFTAARDRGAVAALLYSTQSEACVINSEYTDPDNFDQILDIFATKAKSSARLIVSQFNYVNETYRDFNAKRLNESFLSVNDTISGSANRSQPPPFLMASVTAYNATSSSPNSNATTTNNNTGSDNNNDGKPNTGLAMIVLYAITGCVSILFCVVILSGAIRAIRHPERYGPRSGDPNVHGPGGAPQTRAAGLARAVLDTFPVVKFGRPSANNERYNDAKLYDAHSVEMKRTSGSDLEQGELGTTVRLVDPPTEGVPITAGAGTRQGQPAGAESSPAAIPRSEEVTRAAIGVETCPICIVDFEDGDDLRVLPCEGRHRFHRDCVDQWLLELSSSCPLCREDFAALEAMAAGNSPEDAPPEQHHARGGHNANRFSKYLRFAQRHRRERSGQDGSSANDDINDNIPVPPLDPEHETSTGWRPRIRTGSHP